MINKMTDREAMQHQLMVQDVRLKCLKLAVQSSDTETELNVLGVLGRAQTLFDYVISGEVPAMIIADETVGTGDGI
jgi:hypothetical protein